MKYQSFVSTYSPLKARTLWMKINLIFLLWSALLFLDLLFTIGPLERLDGTREYLTYNFSATLFWVLEAGLTALDMNMQRNVDEGLMRSSFNNVRAMRIPSDATRLCQTWTKEDVENSLELALGVLFLFDSMRVFTQWYTADPDLGAELLDTLLNFAAYLYIVIKLRNLPDDGDNVDSNDYVLDADEINTVWCS